MSDDPAPGRTLKVTRTLTWRLVAVTLLLGAVVCALMWSARPAPESPHDPAATSGGVVAAASDKSAATTTASEDVRAVRPVSLSIPRFDLEAGLTTLDLRRDGTVEVPQDPAMAGWYRRGPVPGELGSSVILGHVDSVDGPAVFARLKDMEPGDALSVTLSDGTVARFLVRSIATYANADFPARKVYGRQGHRDLNIVTCGGAYDAARGGYQANVVVHARAA